MRFLDRRPPFFLMVSTGAACIVVLLVFARLSYGLVLPAMREGLQLSYGQAANLSHQATSAHQLTPASVSFSRPGGVRRGLTARAGALALPAYFFLWAAGMA